MGKKSNYSRYNLTGKRGKILYKGITNDPERREPEHKDEGKKFDKLDTVGGKVTKKTAEKWEEDSLKTYRDGHGGKNPKYNETDK